MSSHTFLEITHETQEHCFCEPVLRKCKTNQLADIWRETLVVSIKCRHSPKDSKNTEAMMVESVIHSPVIPKVPNLVRTCWWMQVRNTEMAKVEKHKAYSPVWSLVYEVQGLPTVQRKNAEYSHCLIRITNNQKDKGHKFKDTTVKCC